MLTMLGSGFPTEFSEVDIVGVGEALRNLTDLGAIDPVVKATVMLSESGFVSIRDAVAFGEFKDESVTGESLSWSARYTRVIRCVGKLKSLFGKESSATAAPTDETAATSDATSVAADEAEPPVPTPKKVVNKDPIPLDVQTRFPTLAPMTVQEKRTARDRYDNASSLSTFADRLHQFGRDRRGGGHQTASRGSP